MNHYGSITIDNKNLLNDLLSLENGNEMNPYYSEQQQQVPLPSAHFKSQYPTEQPPLKHPDVNSNGLQIPALGRRTVLESPTFTKAEHDIYRYVHSRLSIDGDHAKNHQVVDSLEIPEHHEPVKREPMVPRIGSNRLLSDIAVETTTMPKNLHSADDQYLDNTLVDSLDDGNQQPDTQINNGVYNNRQFQPLQQQQQHHTTAQLLPQPIPILNFNPHPAQFVFDNNQNHHPQAFVQQSPYQQIYPLQSAGGIIVLPTPPPNHLQLIQQAQLTHLGNQQQLVHPLPPNHQVFPLPVNHQFYQAQPPPPPLTHLNNSIQQQQSRSQSQSQQYPQQVDNNTMYNNQYDRPNKPAIQQNQHYEEEMYDEDNQQQQDEGGYEEDDQEDEMKRAQVWNRLQKSRQESVGKRASRNSNKNGGGGNASRASGSLPPPAPKQTPSSDVNYLEKNIEAIRNKENLSHRFPEKKYQALYSKFYKNKGNNSNGKKPPNRLNPIEDDQEYDEHGDLINHKFQSLNISPRQNNKISIPIDAHSLRDKNHINVDIYLRLDEYMPPHEGDYSQRSYDDFDPNKDPLGKHIQYYETKISRSLPGSSGSMNRFKPLPPLNNTNDSMASMTSSKPSYSNSSSYHNGPDKLSHRSSVDNSQQDSYLTLMEKAKNKKSTVKPYTLKDYRNFKKDALLDSNTSTGKLGFDYDDPNYRKKIEVTNKKNDYAERVKLRNKILLSEQQRQEAEETPPQVVPSKNQRAKEYVKTAVYRPRSASNVETVGSVNQRQHPESSGGQQQQTPPPRKTVKKQTQFIQEEPDQHHHHNHSRKQQSNEPPLDFTKLNNRPDDTAMVRIRDPVTSKVRTIYLKDTEIEELSRRHEQDKSRVNSVLNSNGPKPQQQQQQPSGPPRVTASGIVEKPRRPLDVNRQASTVHEEENNRDDFATLLERHNNEKRAVEDFKSQYTNNGGNQDLKNHQISVV